MASLKTYWTNPSDLSLCALPDLSPYPLYLVDKESGVTSVQGVQWELPGIFHTNLLQELKRRVMCYISCTQ